MLRTSTFKKSFRLAPTVALISLFALLCVVAPPVWSQVASDDQMLRDEVAASPQLPVRESDYCIVCGAKLGPGDHVFRLRGRRVPIADGALPEFLARPGHYFAKLQARSALFQESMAQQDARRSVLYVGFLGLLIVLAIGMIAGLLVSRRRSEVGETSLPAFCAGCGSFIHPAALRCGECGAEVTPRYQAEVRRVGQG